MDTEVKVDHVPFSGAGGGEPGFQFLEAVGGGAAVFGGAVDIGFAGKGGAGGERVAAGDGVADEEDAREGGIVGDEVPGGGGAFDEIAFVDREVETVAEVCLENGFPCLARGRQRGEFLLVEAVDALVFGGFFRGGALALAHLAQVDGLFTLEHSALLVVGLMRARLGVPAR